MKKEKTPNIRFKKFEHNWFKECLNKISNSIEYGLNASAKDYDGIHKYLRITDIDDSSRLFLTDKLSSPDVNFTKEDYEDYKLQKNDLLFARTGASVGKTYLYRESDGEVYYAGFLIRARLRDSFDGNFVFQQTLTDKYKRFIEITSQRSGQPGVNGKEYGGWKIGMTSYHEQSAIGSLFRTLDELLASYKDNLANYQSLKATMLSKMFPKVGQTVPEIRLDGFEGEWKKAKLKDVAHRVQGNDGRMDLPTLTISASGGWMNQIDRFSANIAGKEQKNYTLLKKGELSYNHGNSKLAKYGVVFELKEYEEALVPKVYHSFRVNQLADAKFIEIMFSTKIPDRELGKLVSSGARMDGLLNISFDDFMNIAIIIPTLEEQQAIGSYFSNLDNLIAAHQEKISQLETLKKKLLQDMFI